MSGREAFEAWFAQRRYGGVVFDGPHHYRIDIDSSVANRMFEAWQARDSEIAAKNARIAELEAELRKMVDLISESKGVAGFHLNGELAEWEYFDLPQTIEEALR